MTISFKDPETRYLIDYANLKGGLIKYQKNFLNKNELFKFYKNKFYGVPLLLPFGIKFFDYSDANFLKLTKLIFRKMYSM